MILKVNKKMDTILKIIEKKNGNKLYYILDLLDNKPNFRRLKKQPLHIYTHYISVDEFSEYVKKSIKIENDENYIQMRANRIGNIDEVRDAVKRKETILNNLLAEYESAEKNEKYYFNGDTKDLLKNGYKVYEKYGSNYNKGDIWINKENKYYIKIDNINYKFQAKVIDFILENKNKKNFFTQTETLTLKGFKNKVRLPKYYISYESGEIIDLKDKDNMEYQRLMNTKQAMDAVKENDTELKDMIFKELNESDLMFEWKKISEDFANQIIELEKLGIIKKDLSLNQNLEKELEEQSNNNYEMNI